MIAVINYLIFLRRGKYLHHIEKFKEVGSQEFKIKRMRTIVLTFLISGFLAIAIAALNNLNIRNWLMQ
jgi:hypothetical protein